MATPNHRSLPPAISNLTMATSNRRSPPPTSIFHRVVKFWKFLKRCKVDLVFIIVNLTCEFTSVILEQVARNKPVYFWGGLGCAVAAAVFAVGELLWMKKNSQKIRILDWIGLVAALSQIINSILDVCVWLHKLSPINFSIFSLIFALASACYNIIWKSLTQEFAIDCKKNILHSKTLQVCEEIYSKKTVFECPYCADGEQNQQETDEGEKEE